MSFDTTQFKRVFVELSAPADTALDWFWVPQNKPVPETDYITFQHAVEGFEPVEHIYNVLGDDPIPTKNVEERRLYRAAMRVTVNIYASDDTAFDKAFALRDAIISNAEKQAHSKRFGLSFISGIDDLTFIQHNGWQRRAHFDVYCYWASFITKRIHEFDAVDVAGTIKATVNPPHNIQQTKEIEP